MPVDRRQTRRRLAPPATKTSLQTPTTRLRLGPHGSAHQFFQRLRPIVFVISV
jgi:hypothetical protein